MIKEAKTCLRTHENKLHSTSPQWFIFIFQLKKILNGVLGFWASLFLILVFLLLSFHLFPFVVFSTIMGVANEA